MRKLVAKVPILFNGRPFSSGDGLPTSNPAMVKAWISAGSAEWEEVKAPVKEKKGKPEKVEKTVPEEVKEETPKIDPARASLGRSQKRT